MAYRDRDQQREAERRWYRQNRERVFEKKNRKKAELRALVRALKDTPCTDCGVTYPYYVMDFDHLDAKDMNISTLVNRGGRRKLLAELEKCEVVCANCHRVRTWRRLGETAPVPPPGPDMTALDPQLRLFDPR